MLRIRTDALHNGDGVAVKDKIPRPHRSASARPEIASGGASSFPILKAPATCGVMVWRGPTSDCVSGYARDSLLTSLGIPFQVQVRSSFFHLVLRR
jgi:hypothetical protein